MMVKNLCCVPIGVAEVFLIMPECHKTFAVKKGLCETSMCGWRVVFIYTPAVEDAYAKNMYQRSELDWLIYNNPAGYAELILNGDPEAYLKAVTEYKLLD